MVNRGLQLVRVASFRVKQTGLAQSASGNATVILEGDDELEHGVKVQVRVVADGEEQVVLQTNVEMTRCSSSKT